MPKKYLRSHGSSSVCDFFNLKTCNRFRIKSPTVELDDGCSKSLEMLYYAADWSQYGYTGAVGTSADNSWSLQSPLPHTLMAKLFSSGAPHILPQFCNNSAVVWSANDDGSALTFKASSKVNLLNDSTF